MLTSFGMVSCFPAADGGKELRFAQNDCIRYKLSIEAFHSRLMLISDLSIVRC